MLRFIKTTILGGVLFILPLVLLAVLIEKAIHLLSGPLQKILPMFAGFTVAGVTAISVAAIVALLFLCFIAGLLARTAAATRSMSMLEDRVLGNLPGYQLLKDAASRAAGMDDVEGAKVVLIDEGEWTRFGLALESRDEWLLVYLPDGGPAGGTAGEVRMVHQAQLQFTDIPWLPLLACLRRGGRGALELSAAYLPDSKGRSSPAL
ncbi:hypothetical protein [Pseudomonas inefficax]|uniref:hypothetical protein n=1 Tax=Pseudomonas inefficax TaxID=2078786 RepID=UPI004046E8ED